MTTSASTQTTTTDRLAALLQNLNRYSVKLVGTATLLPDGQTVTLLVSTTDATGTTTVLVRTATGDELLVDDAQLVE